MKYRPFEDLYKKVLVQEMNQEVIDYITSHRKEPLPWDNLFGDKKRMVIPLEKETRFSDIVDNIRNIPNFHSFDPETEQVVFKKPRDPKYGKGDFYLQGKSIGSVINDLPVSDARKKNLLSVFSTYKAEFLKELANPSRSDEYSIVFSRSPNDVIRVSDWPALKSCLSKKGCNFHRVAHEAINGGGVAYVVKNEYLDGFKDDPDFLNGEDTFSDKQRDLEAVQEPESRIRIRRFVNDKGMDFAVPENALFGNQRLPTFWQSMVNYLKPLQPSAEEVKNAFKTSDILLKGSSYGMQDLEDMLSQYFGEPSGAFINYDSEDQFTKSDHERIKSIAKNDTPDFEDELADTDARYPLEHANAGWDIDADGEGDEYYHYHGGISFDFEDLVLSEDVDEDLSDSYDIRRRARVGDNFGSFIQELGEHNFSNLEMTGYYYNSNRNEMYIGLTPEDSISSTPDDYDNFRYNLKREDDTYEDTLEEITQMLLRYDLIESAENRPGEYQRLRADMNEEIDWENFRHEASLKNLKLIKYAASPLIVKNRVGQFSDDYLQNAHFETEFTRFCRMWKDGIEASLEQSIFNLMDHNFRPPSMKSSVEQGELPLVYEQMRMHPSQNLVDFEIKILFFADRDKDVIDYGNFSLTTNTAKDVAFELADYLDDMWPHIERMMSLIAWECVKQTVDTSSNIENDDNQYVGYMPRNLVQLQRMYGRYVDLDPIGKI